MPSAWLKNREVDEIDVFLCNRPRSINGEKTYPVNNLLDVGVGTLAAAFGEILRDDLRPFEDYQRERPDTQINVYAPAESLDSFDPLCFEPNYLSMLAAIGAGVGPVELRQFVDKLDGE